MRSFLQGKGQNNLKFFQDTSRIRVFGNAVRRFGPGTLPGEQLVFHSSSGGINFQLDTGKAGGNQGVLRKQSFGVCHQIWDLGLRGD